MGTQRSKRSRDQPPDLWLPGYRRPKPVRSDDSAYLYRKVDDDKSIDALNRSTRQAKGPKATRILDQFTLTLLYPSKLEKARQRSKLTQPPTAFEVAQKLGELPISSLTQPVVAEVVTVRQYVGAIGVYVRYPEYQQEQKLLHAAVNDMMELTGTQRLHFGPGEPHISIVKGQLGQTQINQIKGSLPAQIHLSSAQGLS